MQPRELKFVANSPKAFSKGGTTMAKSGSKAAATSSPLRAWGLQSVVLAASAAIAISTLGSSCQRKTSKTKPRISKEQASDHRPPPRGEPVEIAGSLAAERAFFQTR